MNARAVDFLTKPVNREQLFTAIGRAVEMDAAAPSQVKLVFVRPTSEHCFPLTRNARKTRPEGQLYLPPITH